MAGYTWSLAEETAFDPNFGRPVRKHFPAYVGATAQSVYLGYTFGGHPMQTGFARAYLPSNPRSSNASRYLYRAEAANARGQITEARFGSGDSSQSMQRLLDEYDEATGWLLSRCSGTTVCSNVAPTAVNNSYALTSTTLRLGYQFDAFGNVVRAVNVGKRPNGISDEVRWETFTYDPLHRLVGAQRGGPATLPAGVSYAYSPVGNLSMKSDFSFPTSGAYSYAGAGPVHGVKSVLVLGGGKPRSYFYDYDQNGNVRGRHYAELRPSTFSDLFGYDIDNRPQWQSVGTGQRVDFYTFAGGKKALQVQKLGASVQRVVIYAGS